MSVRIAGCRRSPSAARPAALRGRERGAEAAGKDRAGDQPAAVAGAFAPARQPSPASLPAAGTYSQPTQPA